MILHVANPIYDSVFKYIMSDERISKTILSALLKKEVVKVEMRPHEYVNTTRDTLSMFRIDFAATVREKDAEGEGFKGPRHPYRTAEDMARHGDPALPPVSGCAVQ